MEKENKLSFVYKYLKGDKSIWLIVAILSLFSLLLIYTSTSSIAYKNHLEDTSYYLRRHFSIILFGWVLMYVTHKFSYKFYSSIGIVAYVLAIPLLIYTLFSPAINDASRWIQVPIIGSFQTSDLAKIATVLALAAFLKRNKGNIKEKKTFRNAFLIIAIPCSLILTENFSTAMLLGFSCFLLMCFSGIRNKYILMLSGTAALIALLFFLTLKFVPSESLEKVGRFATWKNRIENYSSEDPSLNYQVFQAQMAIANSRVVGRMPGNSTQKNFIPHPYSDYVFAIIVEEYGLFGAIGVLFLYLWLLSRFIKIAKSCQGSFGSYAVLGLGFMLVMQAMINMGVAVDLFPVTGQPLPFVSMGGTSMLFAFMSVGIILSVSAANEENKIVENNGRN